MWKKPLDRQGKKIWKEIFPYQFHFNRVLKIVNFLLVSVCGSQLKCEWKPPRKLKKQSFFLCIHLQAIELGQNYYSRLRTLKSNLNLPKMIYWYCTTKTFGIRNGEEETISTKRWPNVCIGDHSAKSFLNKASKLRCFSSMWSRLQKMVFRTSAVISFSFSSMIDFERPDPLLFLPAESKLLGFGSEINSPVRETDRLQKSTLSGRAKTSCVCFHSTNDLQLV